MKQHKTVAQKPDKRQSANTPAISAETVAQSAQKPGLSAEPQSVTISGRFSDEPLPFAKAKVSVSPVLSSKSRSAETPTQPAEQLVLSKEVPVYEVPVLPGDVPSADSPGQCEKAATPSVKEQIPEPPTAASNRKTTPFLAKGGFGFVPPVKKTSKTPKPEPSECQENSGGTRKKNRKKQAVGAKTG